MVKAKAAPVTNKKFEDDKIVERMKAEEMKKLNEEHKKEA